MISLTRTRWEALHSRLDYEAQAAKSANDVVVQMVDAYRDLTNEARADIDGLLAEWVLSGDEKKRFLGLALIGEYSIRSAIPALRELAEQLKASREVSAPYDLAKTERILARLSA